MSGHKKDFLKSPSAITAARRGPLELSGKE
ncbi:MAG: hypothetical protein PG979_000687 [Rickettsia asembonensis]|nr:MAG: hypothetical protein PG979_000687 [Rickettsia asembonensis]